MLEKVRQNIAMLFGLWIIVSIVYRIFGGHRDFFELVSNGFAFSCFLWIPLKVYMNVDTATTGVEVDEFGNERPYSFGLRAAGCTVLGIILLVLALNTLFSEAVTGVIVGLLFLVSFFVL